MREKNAQRLKSDKAASLPAELEAWLSASPQQLLGYER